MCSNCARSRFGRSREACELARSTRTAGVESRDFAWAPGQGRLRQGRIAGQAPPLALASMGRGCTLRLARGPGPPTPGLLRTTSDPATVGRARSSRLRAATPTWHSGSEIP
jgi:hypothetical protein